MIDTKKAFDEIRENLEHSLIVEEKKYPLTDREKILIKAIRDILDTLRYSN